MALDIRSWFVRELDVDMPLLKILGGNSILDLIKESMEKLPVTLVDIKSLPATADDDDEVTGGTPVPVIVEPEPEPQAEASPRTAEPSITTSDHSRIRELLQLQSTAPSSTVSSTRTPSYIQDSDYVETSSSTSGSSVDERNWRDEVIETSKETTAPMSYGQTRFWFLHHALQDKTTFNVAISIRLTGRLRADDLDQALRAVAQKHEAMRTRYFWSDENMDIPMQSVLSQPLVRLEKRRISSKAEADKALDEMRDYKWNLGDWEAMRFILLSLSDTEH